jgi:hypothetical protein
MKEIHIKDLQVGRKCLFQLSTWSPVNLKHVTIRYVGAKYVVMHNTQQDEEYCVSIDAYDCALENRTPVFYVDENYLF